MRTPSLLVAVVGAVLTAAAAALAPAGCGARPGLDPLVDDAGSPPRADAAVVPPSPDAAPPDAGPPLPVSCTWTADGVLQVTEPPSDKSLHSMAVSDRAVLLGWRTSNPDPPHDNTYYLQTLAFDGRSAGAKVALFPPPAGWSHGAMSLAAGHGHYGATAWDDTRGCRFRPLDASGQPTDDARHVGADRCSRLRATGAGFTAITHRGWPYERRRIQLDAAGALVSTSERIAAMSDGPYWWSAADLPGAEVVVAGMTDDIAPTAIRTQRLDAGGRALAEPTEIVALPTPANRVGLVAPGAGGVLAGWLASPTAEDGQERRLTLLQLDDQGRPIGTPFPPTRRPAYRDAGWSVVPHGDGAAAVIVEPLDSTNAYGDATALVLLLLDAQGALRAPPIELARQRFIRRPLVRITPAGILVGYTAMPEGPHQVFVARARCIADPAP